MATLKELSEHTGYSITTISRVLNNDPTMSVSDATRAAILEAAGALNYKKPSPRQRRDAAGHLCFAVAEMLSPVEQLKDPYYLYLKNHGAALSGSGTQHGLTRRVRRQLSADGQRGSQRHSGDRDFFRRSDRRTQRAAQQSGVPRFCAR